jgi:ATP-dependent RNA helicase DeaD
MLDSLGYRGRDAGIRTGMAAPPGTELVVLFDLPASREELREAASGAERRIALVQPRQLASLRLLAAGGGIKPLTLGEPAARARGRDESLRAELRRVLAGGQYGRELLALEGLLDEFDGAEIAAAAVQLLERERAARAAAKEAPSPADSRDRAESGMTRLFMTIGSRDNARPGDIVGAVANTAGISSAQIGKIDLRESHATIEVASDVADAVIERVTGTSIKGRRVVIRREKHDGGGSGERERREPRGDRRPARGERREPRGERREPRGERREPRGERRPARGPRFGERE